MAKSKSSSGQQHTLSDRQGTQSTGAHDNLLAVGLTAYREGGLSGEAGAEMRRGAFGLAARNGQRP